MKIHIPKNQELKIPKESEITKIPSETKIIRELPPIGETPTPREHPRAERSSPRTFGDRITKFK